MNRVQPIIEEEDMPVMNNPRLEKFSQQHQISQHDVIEKKCFFLFGGSDLENGTAFALEMNY